MVNSITKVLCIAAISLGVIYGYESISKIRVYKDLLQSVFSKNLKLILDRAEKQQEKDVSFPDLNAKLTNIEIKVQPRNKDWDNLQLELFFDEGNIVLEAHDLEFSGRGEIPLKGEGEERVEFHAPMSTCQIVMSIGEEYASWGSFYPRINVEQVMMQIDEQLITVSAFGDLPLYKSHQFEKAVKQWFVGQLSKRQTDFKNSLQDVEKNIWRNVKFTQAITPSVKLNTSLSEPLDLKGDYLYASFLNEFITKYDIDYAYLEEKLQQIQPAFSNDNAYRKDIQFTFDENLINNQLTGLFTADRTYSLTDILLSNLPDGYKNYGSAASQFLTTIWFAKWFPEIIKDHGIKKRVDLKCGFSKSFLTGQMTEARISQVRFKDPNRVEFTTNFGCGLFVGPEINDNPMALFQAFMGGASKGNPSDWINYRSFFISVDGFAEFDFVKSNFNNAIKTDLIQGTISDFDFKINELKVYKGEKNVNFFKEVREEEERYNQWLQDWKKTIKGSTINQFRKKVPFMQGIPITPYPKFEKCTGLKPYGANMEILEGYIRIGFDVQVTPADESCLFEMFEDQESKYKRWAKDFKLPNTPKFNTRLDRDKLDKFGNIIKDQVGDRFGDKLEGLGEKVGDKIGDKIGEKFGSKIGDQVGDKIGKKLGGLFG